MIYNEEFETLPREVLESVQLKRLQQVSQRVYHTVGFYRKSFDKAGINPDDIKSLSDIRKLPFTTKPGSERQLSLRPLRRTDEPYRPASRFIGNNRQGDCRRIQKRDIDTWSELMARCLVAAGLTKNDIIHNAYGYGLFTGGLGAHYGAEKLGAAVIPISGGNAKRQIMIMQDFGSTVLLCTPSYALNLADVMKEMEVDPKTLKLRVGLFGAEPWSENMRQEIEARLNIKAIDIFGLSEVMGPGVASECIEEKHGLHVFEDFTLRQAQGVPSTGSG